jgi:hypothetical protein
MSFKLFGFFRIYKLISSDGAQVKLKSNHFAFSFLAKNISNLSADSSSSSISKHSNVVGVDSHLCCVFINVLDHSIALVSGTWRLEFRSFTAFNIDDCSICFVGISVN